MAYIPTKTRRIAAQPVNRFEIENFRGNDFTNEPANVAACRSPYAPNLIRESAGKVRKRTGTFLIKKYPAAINGCHVLRGTTDKRIIHAGTVLYLDKGTGDCQDDAVLYTAANNRISVSRQMGGKLWILDGKAMLVFDGSTVKPVADLAYIPTILIAKPPTGGGTSLEPVNLLQPKRTERFAGTAADTVYQLAAQGIDSAAVTVEKRNASGGLDSLTEGTHFTVDRTNGKVTFTTAPGVSPKTGEDNVYITYAKTVEGYAEKINSCDVCTLYGVGGSRDRLFVAGAPSYPNQDYYSQLDNPAYFGDLWYATLGQDNAKIMGYCVVNDQLVTVKDSAVDDTNIFLRKGTLSNGQAAFVSSGSYQGSGAVAKHSFADLENEPVFLTENGIYAITPSDVLGERYAQLRSRYLNGRLHNETNLKDAYAIKWNQFYVLAVGDHFYLLDGLQFSSDKNTPFSHRQYEGYYWENLKARVLWQVQGQLFFGKEDGSVVGFYEDYDALGSFNDMGQPISAKWTTAEFYGDTFYNNKTFSKIAVLLGAAVATGCRVWAIYDGAKELLRDYDSTARYFSYAQFSYAKMSYKTDRTPQQLIEKIKVKKVKKIQFLFENDVLNEPFGLYMATAEFTESR